MAEQEAVTQDATNWALARQAETAERNPEGQESAPQPEQDTHTAPAEQDAEAVDLAQQRAENGNAPHKAGVPGGVQKKIDKLTRRAKTAENELRFLKERRIQAGHGLTEADAQEIDAVQFGIDPIADDIGKPGQQEPADSRHPGGHCRGAPITVATACSASSTNSAPRPLRCLS